GRGGPAVAAPAGLPCRERVLRWSGAMRCAYCALRRCRTGGSESQPIHVAGRSTLAGPIQPVGRNKGSALRHRRECGVRPMSLPLPVFVAASVFCDGAAQCAALIAPYGGVEPAVRISTDSCGGARVPPRGARAHPRGPKTQTPLPPPPAAPRPPTPLPPPPPLPPPR